MLGFKVPKIRNSRGFTLIEMSIVLVIIGLIIGGILKGQEIIESSRQKNVITQIDSLRAAINTFGDKYNGLPGDYSLAATRIQAGLDANGNDDGIIGASTYADTGTMDGISGILLEHVHFWNHLAAAELIGGTTVNGGVAGFGELNALPAVAVPGAGMTVIYGNHNTIANNARQTHWARIHKGIGGTSNTAADGAFSGKRAFEMDLKLDDGNAHNGNFRVADDDEADCAPAATGVYAALSNNPVCAIYFELLQ